MRKTIKVLCSPNHYFCTNHWNNKSLHFWQKQQSTYNGVLLGFEEIHSIDVKFSNHFIEKLLQEKEIRKMGSVLDCGAGIGRVSKQVLNHYFGQIDLLQQCQHYIQAAKGLLAGTNARKYYCHSVQQFNFQQQYDCIWMQWVLTHLKEGDAALFLAVAKKNINLGGFIIIKENVSKKARIIDYQDSTIIRTDAQWKQLFKSCGLKIIRQEIQKPWLSQLQEVKMYGLI